jgi:hypothetical protein
MIGHRSMWAELDRLILQSHDDRKGDSATCSVAFSNNE